ncbi:hypothetical protein [Kitasatospora griseola]
MPLAAAIGRHERIGGLHGDGDLVVTAWELLGVLARATALARQGRGRGIAEHWQILKYCAALGTDRLGTMRLSKGGLLPERLYRAMQARAIVRRLDEIGEELPKARRTAGRLHDDVVRGELDERTRREEIQTQEAEVIRYGRALRTVLATPDIVRGAALNEFAGELSIPDPSQEDARTRLRALQTLVEAVQCGLDPERRDISDTALLNRFNELRDQLAGGYDPTLEEPDGIKVCRLVDDTGPHDVALDGERIARQADDARARLTDREREVFQRFLTGELGDHLSTQLLAAGALVDALNTTLRSVRTSHGLGVELDWRLADTVDADIRAAVELLRSPSGLRTREQTEQLREILQRRPGRGLRCAPADRARLPDVVHLPAVGAG